MRALSGFLVLAVALLIQALAADAPAGIAYSSELTALATSSVGSDEGSSLSGQSVLRVSRTEPSGPSDHDSDGCKACGTCTCVSACSSSALLQGIDLISRPYACFKLFGVEASTGIGRAILPARRPPRS